MPQDRTKKLRDEKLEKEYRDLESALMVVAATGGGVFAKYLDTTRTLHDRLCEAEEEIEKNKLLRKCTRLLLKKLTLNDIGTDKECREAYKELNAAFEELEAFEREYDKG